jgi:hypothetical protein
MKRIVTVLALGLFAGSGFGQPVTKVSGWVEDGVAHTPGNSSETVKQAIASGAPYVFVDDTNKIVWRIDNPGAVKGHEGHHVAFSGTMDPNMKTIHIEKLTMMKDQTPGAKADAIGH